MNLRLCLNWRNLKGFTKKPAYENKRFDSELFVNIKNEIKRNPKPHINRKEQ